MLDFNKLENDTLRLHVEQKDIIAELRRYLALFAMNAEEKGITIRTQGLEGSLTMWLDTDKLEKIFNNLMSNAMKFTPRGGAIDVIFDTLDNGRRISLSIADTGKGIPSTTSRKAPSTGGQASDSTMPGNWPGYIMARCRPAIARTAQALSSLWCCRPTKALTPRRKKIFGTGFRRHSRKDTGKRRGQCH